MPQLWVVAGPNGAGKSTLTGRRLLDERLRDWALRRICSSLDRSLPSHSPTLTFSVTGIPLNHRRYSWVYRVEGGQPMPKRLHVELELPDEVAAQLHEAEMAVKAKEALVME